MYSLVQTFKEAGVFGYIHLGLSIPAVLWALVCAVLLGLRWRVPPVVAGAPLLLVPFLIGVGSIWAYGVVDEALVNVEPAMRATLLAAGIAEGMSQGWFGLFVLPVAAVLGLGGLAAGVRAPRSWGAPGLLFLVAGLTALVPLAGLMIWTPLPWVLARVLLYGVAVVPLALAAANAHPKGNGPEGGMIAAMSWISLVGAMELVTVNSQWARGFGALAYVDPDSRDTMLAVLGDEVGTQALLGWVLLALSAVPALVCAFRSGPPPTEEEILEGDFGGSPWRGLGRVLALGVWVLWAFAIAASSPASALEDIARL